MSKLSSEGNRFIFEGKISPSSFLEKMEATIPWDEIVHDLQVNARQLGIRLIDLNLESLLRLRFLQIWFDIHPSSGNPKWINHLYMRAFAKLNTDLTKVLTSMPYYKFKFAMDECCWNADFIIALTQHWSGIEIAPDIDSEFGGDADFFSPGFSPQWAPTLPTLGGGKSSLFG